MAINKSEEFVYFQNKAKHYDNIKKMKPVVKDKLQKSYRNTINHEANHKKYMEPLLKQHTIKVENQHMINRLLNINQSKRTQVSVTGDYSRYFKIQRSFRSKNPHKNEVDRRISLENAEMVARLQKSRPRVGNNSVWSTQYKQKLSHRRNLSRYLGNQQSKGSLHISTDRFVPQHYRSFIYKDQQLDSPHNGNTVAVLPKQKLIQLPKIISSNKSKSALQTDRSHQTLQI